MAKLVTKFKYLKPNARKGAGGYAKYIATREGVDKIDESQKFAPATSRQKKLIERIVSDFPGSSETLEYDDYRASPTRGNAHEFIFRALEEHCDEAAGVKTYADYIATRPRAERFGSHGLFTDDGVPVNLQRVSRELNLHDGNIWTAIISLRREDAQRLGYDHGERWRSLLRAQTQEFSEQFHIPMKNLKWFAAFHNESHHPHVHLMIYSSNPGEGFLSEQGVQKLRSSIAKEIFSQDLLTEYAEQTQRRDELKTASREKIAQIVGDINRGVYDNPSLESKLKRLAERLSAASGKKVYGYLKPELKDLVDEIVTELASDRRIAALYDLWYLRKESAMSVYRTEMPERVELVDNPEFRSIKNTVIDEATRIARGKILTETYDPEESGEETDEEIIDDPEQFTSTPVFERDNKKAENGDHTAQYRLAKIYLDRSGDHYDPSSAVKLLIQSANRGNSAAKYLLGKLFLYGEDVPKNMDIALRWLEEACANRNPDAQYLLGKTLLRGEDSDRDADRAEELLRLSADAGNQYAQYSLGKALLDGDMLTQNIPDSIDYLKRSSEQGNQFAQYLYGKLLFRGELIRQDINLAMSYLEKSASQGNSCAEYLLGKIYLTEDGIKDVQTAIRRFMIAAEKGNSYAEYQLGKLFLFGDEIEKNLSLSVSYLSSASAHGNQYASQLLHSMENGGDWAVALGSLRLLRSIGNMIQQKADPDHRVHIVTERKLLREIEEKRRAHGLKHG